MKRNLSLLWRLKKGFTLIEILIAVTILVVVAVALFSTFRGGTAAWQMGTAHARRNAETRVALEMMTRELSKATIIAADGAYQIDFVSGVTGAENQIFFIGSLETPEPGQPDLMKARYDLGPPPDPLDPTRRNLRRSTALIDIDLLANFPAIPPPPPPTTLAALASDITNLTFEFFDAQPLVSSAPAPGWRTDWDSRRRVVGDEEVTAEIPETVNTLPDAVRITLTSHPDGLAAKDFSVVIELPRADPQPFDFAILLSPTSYWIMQGNSVGITTAVDVVLTGGTAEEVFLMVDPGTVPYDVFATLLLPISGDPNFNTTLTITTGSNATTGTHAIRVIGWTASGVENIADYTLTVYSTFDFSLSVSPTEVSVGSPVGTADPSPNNVTANVTATLEPGAIPESIGFTWAWIGGEPAGTTVTILPDPLTPTDTAILTIGITDITLLGNYTIRITGTETDGGVTPATYFIYFTLRVFDFSLSVDDISMGQGGSGGTVVTATLEAGSGTPAPVTTSLVSISPVYPTPTPPPGGEITISGHGSITPTPSPGSSITLTVATTPATPPGNYTIEIAAEGGGITRTETFTLSVLEAFYTLSVSPDVRVLPGGSDTTVVTATLNPGATTQPVTTYNASALPPGVTIGVHGDITPTLNPTPNDGSSITLTVSTTAALTPLGNHTITIGANAAGPGNLQTTTFTLSVFDFSLSVPDIHVFPDSSETTDITATLDPLSGTPAPVETSLVFIIPVSPTPPPAGTITITGHDEPPPHIIPTGSRTLTVTTTSATPPGDYLITIRAGRGGITQTATFTLSVVDFSLTVNPTSRSVREGDLTTTTVTVTVYPDGGTIPGGVTLSASDLPPDASARFFPNNLASTFDSILTITTSTGDMGRYDITITGTSGNQIRTTPSPFVLTVTRLVIMDFGSPEAQAFEDSPTGTIGTIYVLPTHTNQGEVTKTDGWTIGAQITYDDFDDTDNINWSGEGLYSALRTPEDLRDVTGGIIPRRAWVSAGGASGWWDNSEGNTWVERGFNLVYGNFVPPGATIDGATLKFDYQFSPHGDFDDEDNHVFFFAHIHDGGTTPTPTDTWHTIDGGKLGGTNAGTPHGDHYIHVWDIGTPPEYRDNPTTDTNNHPMTHIWAGGAAAEELGDFLNLRKPNALKLRFKLFIKLDGGFLDAEYFKFWVDDARIEIDYWQ